MNKNFFMNSVSIWSKDIFKNNSQIKTKDFEPLKLYKSQIIASIGELKYQFNIENVFNFALKLKHFLLLSNQRPKVILNLENKQINTNFYKIIYFVLSTQTDIDLILFEKNPNFSWGQTKNELTKQGFDFFIYLNSFEDKKNSFFQINIFKKNWNVLDQNQIDQFNNISLEKQEIDSRWTTSNLDQQIKQIDPLKLKQNIEQKADFYLLHLKELKHKYSFFNDLNQDTRQTIFYINKNHFLPFSEIKFNYNKKLFLNKLNQGIIWKKIARNATKDTDVIFWLKNKNIDILYKNKLFFEYLSKAELQLIFLEFLNQKYLDNKQVKFLVYTQTPEFIKKFLKSFFQQQIIFYSEENIEDYLIEKNRENEVFLINQHQVFYFPKANFSNFDLTSQMFFYVKMLEVVKQKNTNFFSYIQELKQKLNFESRYEFKINLTYNYFQNFYQNIQKDKTFASLNIKNFQIIEANQYSRFEKIKVFLEKNVFVFLIYDKIKQQLKTLVISDLNQQSYQEAIIIENQIKKELKNQAKQQLQRKQKKKTAIKVFILASIIILILIFLFYQVYKLTNQNAEESFATLLNGFYDVFLANTKKRLFFIYIILYFVFYALGSGFLMYRVMKKIDVPMKFRHITLALFLGIFTAYSTPFYFGGEIVQYWYLQKKGYKLRKLLSAFTYSAFLHQIYLLIYSLIMFPLALYFYRDNLLVFDSVNKIILLVWLIFTMFINLFLTLVILVLSIWTKLQLKCIKLGIWLISFNPLKILQDKNRLDFFFQAEAQLFKKNFQFVIKDFKFFLETFIYKAIIFSLINMSFFILLQTTYTAHELSNYASEFPESTSFVDYIKFLAGSNILTISNNLNPTPSGLGSIDLISLIVFKNYFPVTNANPLIANEGDYYLKVFNFSSRIFTWLVPYVASSLFLLIVWFGEKRLDKFRSISYAMTLDSNLNKKQTRTHFIYYKVAYSIYAIVIIAILLAIFLS